MANSNLPLTAGRRAVELAIVARGGASLTASELAAVRQRSFDRFPNPLRPQFLKHSDEQTLAALTALACAIERYDIAHDFRDWAIVSATRYLGRAAFAAVIDKYRIDGPWGVSVQVIPHTAPHALAGTVSLALGSRGPSIGAGAARGEESQALLAAATLLQTHQIRGAWVVLTGWSADNELLSPEELACGASCAAAALAVTSANMGDCQGNRPLGRIVIEPCWPQQDRTSHCGRAVAPLTELLARHAHENLHWETNCRGMHTRLELPAAGLYSAQLGAQLAA